MGRRGRLGAIALLPALLGGGCAVSSQLVPTQPSGIVQQLVARSLERALAGVDVTRFAGRGVALHVFTQIGDRPLAREMVAAWLEEHGVRVAEKSESADLTMKVFLSALGTDRGETFVGIPSFPVPVVAVPFPEIALFKWVRNRGVAEVRAYAFDGTTGAFVDKVPPAVGRAKQDNFTVLLFIGFTVSDVDERGG